MHTRFRVYRAKEDDERPAPGVPAVLRTMPVPVRVGAPPELTDAEWQYAVGNQATARAHQEPRSATPTVVPALGEDEGRTDEGTFEGVPWTEAATAAPVPAETSEWGEFDGELVTDIDPHVFVDGGKTGAGIVQWVAGGDGGRGNQGVGTITLVAPVYESAPAMGPIGPSAWIRPGTGTATVTRSYRGVVVGANTTQFYFTAAASARADVHEQLHVNSSMLLHMVHILPMEVRIATNTGRGLARYEGSTEAEAIASLQNYINWNATITAFQNADIAANTPLGTVDRMDMADPSFVKHRGPRTVDGVAYADYIDV